MLDSNGSSHRNPIARPVASQIIRNFVGHDDTILVRVRGSPPERLSGTTVARIVVVVVVQPRPCYVCKGTHFRALLVEFSFCPMIFY